MYNVELYMYMYTCILHVLYRICMQYLPGLQSYSKIFVDSRVLEAGDDSVEQYQHEEHLLHTAVVPLVQLLGELCRLLCPLSLQLQSVTEICSTRLLS